jgi:redox-sensing transcriptional repressor
VVGFDTDEKVVGTEAGGKKVLHLEKMVGLCQRMHVNIGVITVPAENAQEVCDLMIEGGIQAIWNFAPVKLVVPENILVHNEDMASSFAVLSKHLKKKISK